MHRCWDTFSANFQLIAAMNPCPCGFYGDTQKPCTWAPAVVTKYQKRISGLSNIVCNADMRVREIRQFCKLPEDGQSLMRARTIADLTGSEEIQSVHLAEALQYRPKLMTI